MISAENLILFTKWISAMPKQTIDKFQKIYFSNISKKTEFDFYKSFFHNSQLVLNSFLFDLSFISKSAYEFDLFIFIDICDMFTYNLINDIKENIINPKGGEIWIFCHNDIKNNSKYVNNTLNKTNFRSSTVKFNDEFSLIIIK